MKKKSKHKKYLIDKNEDIIGTIIRGLGSVDKCPCGRLVPKGEESNKCNKNN